MNLEKMEQRANQKRLRAAKEPTSPFLSSLAHKLSNLQNAVLSLRTHLTGSQESDDNPTESLIRQSALVHLAPMLQQIESLVEKAKEETNNLESETSQTEKKLVEEKVGKSLFESPNSSIIFKIFSLLPQRDLGRVAQVSKQFKAWAYDDTLWKQYPVPWPTVNIYFEEVNRKGTSFREVRKSFNNWYRGRYLYRAVDVPVASVRIDEKYIYSCQGMGQPSLIAHRHSDTGEVVRYLGGLDSNEEKHILTSQVTQVEGPNLFSISNLKGQKFVALWDIEKGQIISAFPYANGDILSAHYSPSDKWLTLGGSRSIAIYDATSGKSIHTLQDWAPCVIQNSEFIISGAWRPCKWNKKLLSSFPTFLNNRPTYTPLPIFVNDIKFGPQDQLIMAGNNTQDENFIVWLDMDSNTHIGENFLGSDKECKPTIYNDWTKIVIGYKKQLLLDFYDPSDAHEQFSCTVTENVARFDASSHKLVAGDGHHLHIFDFTND